MLEYFDEYLVGKGYDKDVQQPELQVSGSATTGVVLQVDRFELDVDRAGIAASQLMATLLGMTPEVQKAFEGH